ncbi:MAG: thiamine pyrophosphate-dependent enzyme [Acidobacteriota bacterium]
MHADDQIEVREPEAEVDIDLEIREPGAAAAAGSKEEVEQLSDEELRFAYRVATRSRTMEEYFVRLVSRGEVKFSIWGPGEEIHGAAAAMALGKVCELGKIGMVLHYRNACLAMTWCALHGYDDFTLDLVRQQFSRSSDPMTGGRQMVNHFDHADFGILPVQSPVGMQLDKAAGYAKGFKVKGVDDGLALAIIGDGTTAEGDLHDAMNAGSVWQLPLIIMVTNNKVAISTQPQEGHGIKTMRGYANAFGFAYDECDGRDFQDCYETTYRAAKYVREQQKPLLMLVDNMPRLNAHSSAADPSFVLDQPDPILSFGEQLVEQGVLGKEDIVTRIKGEGRDYFAHHDPGTIMGEQIDDMKAIIEQVRGESEPAPESLFDHIYPPFPEVQEPQVSGETAITYAGAIRAAASNIMSNYGGVLWGEDVARLGGVMTATAGLKERHPDRIIDAPLNEPMIVGTAVGAGMHDGLVAMPEIQFADYSLNAFHWIVYMGNLYWTSNGSQTSSVILRMPVDPFGGGAVYHSMSVDGYFTPIPGLVVVMPVTSFDVYGLLMTAAEYGNTVVCLEPKFAYRQAFGPAFPGEPTEPGEIAALKKSIMRGEIPDIDPTVRVPFGKAALRRSGSDVTIVAWGRAVWTSMKAAEQLAGDGIEAEVIDLRTLVPPDLDAVYTSVDKTRRLVVAAEDRPFAGFVRSIQGHVVERFEGVPTRAIGQKNVPGIAQSLQLEEATILTEHDVEAAVREVMESKAAAAAPAAAPSGAPSAKGEARGIAWIPPRYYLG